MSCKNTKTFSKSTFVIIRCDEIEKINLNRQLMFIEQDIDLYKISVLLRELKNVIVIYKLQKLTDI